MSDLIALWEGHGEKSGLTGCVQDMSDSSQNNKRAAEMASFKVAHALLDHTPSALGTAVHVTMAASHLSAFVDSPDEFPASPASRIAKLSFVHTMLMFHTIAVIRGHEYDLTPHVHTVNKHGYAAPTRTAAMLALPSLLSIYKLQSIDAAKGTLPPVVVPSECGSQRCESLFSTLRGSSGNSTGPISGASFVQQAPRLLSFKKLEAEGMLKLPASRHDTEKHSKHADMNAYRHALSDEDIRLAIHMGYTLALRLLKGIGYSPLLQSLNSPSKAMKKFLEITRAPKTTVRYHLLQKYAQLDLCS
jgi:hypothetical protein